MMDKIKAGTIVNFSEGEYSDYGYIGTFVAIQDVTQEDYDKAAGEELAKGGYESSSVAVVANLVRTGKLVDVNSVEVHLGCYGRVPSKMDIH